MEEKARDLKLLSDSKDTDTAWDRAHLALRAAATAQGSAALGALKDRGSERVPSVLQEQEHCCSQSLLGATVSPKWGGRRRKKEYLSIFGKVTNS